MVYDVVIVIIIHTTIAASLLLPNNKIIVAATLQLQSLGLPILVAIFFGYGILLINGKILQR